MNKKTRSSTEAKTPAGTLPEEPAGEQPPAWTLFIENPRSGWDRSAADRDQLTGFRSWFSGPTAALLIPYLLMVLGVVCIVALELKRPPEPAPPEPPHIAVDFVPAEVRATAYSSPEGGAWTRNE